MLRTGPVGNVEVSIGWQDLRQEGGVNMARLNKNGNYIKKNIVADILKEISERDGVLKPDAVVDEARLETSPIHDLFDWNDSTAGEKYRLWQARQLIATVRVEYLDREVDAYYNVKLETVPQQGYYPVEQVITNERMYQDVLETAITELKYWHDKYKEIKELKGLIDEEMLQTFQVS